MPYLDTGRISLFYEEAGGGGVAVLLLHELGGSSESWRDVVPLLAADRRIVAVDMRCAGRSEKPPGAFALADAADDIAALLTALRLGQVDVIGAALGSLVGALLALRHPARVRRLMMCAVAADMAGPTRAYVAERAEKVRVVGMRGVADASLANSFPEALAAQRAAYRAIYLANDPAAYAELSLALARLELTAADWGAVRAPVLVASGAHDFLWPPALGRAVAALIPGARFAVIEDAGHFPHLQAPATLARIARGFLDG
ncbi:MAG TPA: alpha/beta fold hydrolase [Stellaceae bacterium]|nr:alpha/beta fold hydrolase [Stellaceae bacterium]